MSIVICDDFIGKFDYMIHCIKNSYGTIDKSMKIGPAQWPHFDLIFVHSGHIQLELTCKQIKLDTSQAILIYPKTPFVGHTITSTARISVHHFSFDDNGNFSSAVKSLVDRRSSYKIFQPYETNTLAKDIDRIVTLAHENVASANKNMCSLLMMLIITQLQSMRNYHYSKSSPSPEFENLINWLNKNFANNITLNDMANEVGLSTSHFRAVFKKQMGISPGNYLLNIRFNESAKLLRETLMPIKKIARLIGYKDITHFYHTFNAKYKITPKTYREKHLPLG